MLIFVLRDSRNIIANPINQIPHILKETLNFVAIHFNKRHIIVLLSHAAISIPSRRMFSAYRETDNGPVSKASWLTTATEIT